MSWKYVHVAHYITVLQFCGMMLL